MIPIPIPIAMGSGHPRSLWMVLMLLVLLAGLPVAVWADPLAISDVALDRASFNPSAGETVTLSIRLASTETPTDPVEAIVYDPDGGSIRRLPTPITAGAGRVIWDGRDDGGAIVPDEAYTFVIETPWGQIHDPMTFSGGVVADLTDASIDPTGNLSYRLPSSARVLIRLGVHNGPLYRTLVDWRPRPAGTVNEPWDGFDEQGLVRVRDYPEFSTLVTYATLPDATVIAYGNAAETYRGFKLGRGRDRPVQARTSGRAGETQADRLVPPAWARAPRVLIAFPDFPDPAVVPTVKHDLAVRIDVDPQDRARLAEDQFEVILYVDGVFCAEAERGYLPLNWTWELDQVPPGERVLTVNVTSFRGQVGTASRKVVVGR